MMNTDSIELINLLQQILIEVTSRMLLHADSDEMLKLFNNVIKKEGGIEICRTILCRPKTNSNFISLIKTLDSLNKSKIRVGDERVIFTEAYHGNSRIIRALRIFYKFERQLMTNPEYLNFAELPELFIEDGKLKLLRGGQRKTEINIALDRFSFYRGVIERGEINNLNLSKLMFSAQDILLEFDAVYRSQYEELDLGPTKEKYCSGTIKPVEIMNDDPPDKYFTPDLRLMIDKINYHLQRLTGSRLDETTIDGQPNPVRWKGTDADLIDLFVTLRDKHYIEASSNYEIIKQLAQHFTGKGGKKLKPANLKSALSQRDLSGNEPFDCIPENPKPENGE